MNHQITELQNKVQLLDQWTQQAVYGSWQFLANAASINAAMRYVPDEPLDTGIETFTEYDAARRTLIRDSEDSSLPALVDLAKTVSGWYAEAGGREAQDQDGDPMPSLYGTYEFLTREAPKEASVRADYINRARLGMRPAMPIGVFIKFEMERLMREYNTLKNRGEDAIRLCETTSIQGSRGELPEWIAPKFEQKLIEKLHNRWEKLEMRRTNPKVKKAQRDECAADQLMICSVLAEYGEEPGFGDMAMDPIPEFDATVSDLSKV